MRVRTSQNRGGMSVLEREIGDEGAAPAEQTRVLDALERLSHPFCHRCALHRRFQSLQDRRSADTLPSTVGLRYVDGTNFVNATSRGDAHDVWTRETPGLWQAKIR